MQMKNLKDEEWIRKANSPPFTIGGQSYNCKKIAEQIRELFKISKDSCE